MTLLRKNFFTFLLFLCSCGVFSQTTILKGKIVSNLTGQPLEQITVRLEEQEEIIMSQFDGTFLFQNPVPGEQTVVILSPETETLFLRTTILPDVENDLGEIRVSLDRRKNLLNESTLVLIDEESIGEEDSWNDMNISSLMTNSNDIYLSNSGYNFSAMRFRFRGYDYRYSSTYINGVNFNDAERGGFSFGLIGGLNDATRNRDAVGALQPASFTYGQTGGAVNINTSAGSFAPGGRIGAAYTNRNYKLQGSALYSTGLMSNGWAFSGSLAYRWADEGFVEGTFYNSLGIFFGTEKQFNHNHSLSFTFLGAPTQRGQQSAAPAEIQELKGHYYNSYWGYQDGEKRNSRVVTTFEPTGIFSHVWKINDETKLVTGLGYKYTTYGSTALNRYNGSDPRPDYYRYLPSYQATPEMQEYYREKWLTDPTVSQVNWNRLYEVNRLNQPDGRGSVYIVEERHNDQSNFTLNSTFNTKLTDRISLTAGLEGRTTRGMHYKTVSDLLGGDFFLDVNQFAQTDFGYDSDQAQYDLNNPNRKATEGDRFGYDYDIYVHSGNAWFQNVHRYNKWDIFYGYKLTYTHFYRKGHMRNGLAPGNSYGKGETHSFIDQESKFGLTYKLSGKHIFSGIVSYATLAPLTYNAYLSPRVKDAVIPDLKSERVFSSEVSYALSTPLVTGKITAYQTNFYDQARMYNLYYDLDGTFVNYALTGIDKIHRGLELGVEIKLNSNFILSGIGTISEYYYSNRPTGTISYENGSAEDKTETVYLKNFYVAGTPQMAGTIGLHYFNNYWFLDLKLNGFDRTYIDLSPMKRTESAISSLDAYTYEELEEIVANATKQEKFAGGGTLDFSIGKVFRIQRKYTMTVNLQFNNILNNKNLKTGGYEYNRIDTDDVTSNKFPSYYYYAQGFNCYLSAGFRF